jgi:sugar phosphate isomerase/epimerase
MKVGVDGKTIADVEGRGSIGALRFAKEQGVDGVFFSTILDISPTLDLGELHEARELAGELRLYLDCGIGSVNPYNFREFPEVLALGDGDYRVAIERMIRAARSIDCVELSAEAATPENKPFKGAGRNDRFRSDVDWDDQLHAMEKFLSSLAPLLREQGCRIDVENHGEITTGELVRLVEAAGPETVGITFNSGDTVLNSEDPLAAARRVAPYTHLVHAKDCVLYPDENGLVRQVKSCGEGMIDWESLLPILWEHCPSLDLSFEDHKGLMRVPVFDPCWRAHQSDLDIGETLHLVCCAWQYEKSIVKEHKQDPLASERIPYQADRLDRLQAGAKRLRQIIQSRKLQDTPVRSTLNHYTTQPA